MDKKLIAEDIQRMRFMFGYEPGKVISEQQDSSEDGIFSNLDDNELEGVLDAILDTEKSDYTHLANSKDDEEDNYDPEYDEDFGTMGADGSDDLGYDDEEDFEEEDEVIYEIEVEEGFDSPEMKDFRGDKDFSEKEFKKIPKGVKPNMNTVDRDDSITTGKYINNMFDDYLDDADLSWLDESWDEE
jgi:hypothetical protein